MTDEAAALADLYAAGQDVATAVTIAGQDLTNALRWLSIAVAGGCAAVALAIFIMA